MYIFYIILFIVFFISPAEGKILLFIINLFIPDPIPYVDEIIMLAGMFAGRN